jgi:DNA polymerase-3 subunit gamma/tau
MGYDLRAVCRELSRVVRDLLVLIVDPSRLSDPEIAGETERDRLKALAARFSREDLLRAFDLLTRAEADIRTAAQPRYDLEMALLRWIHLRKLVPLEELLAGGGTGFGQSGEGRTPQSKAPAAPARPSSSVGPKKEAAPIPARLAAVSAETPASGAGSADRPFKDVFLAQIKASKAVLYNMVVAQAQKIDVASDRVTFTFSPAQKTLATTLEQNRPWLEVVAQQIAGRRIVVSGVMAEPPPPVQVGPKAETAGNGAQKPAAAAMPDATKNSTLREQAMADASVQALLEVFPAEIRDVEEM